MRNNLLALGAVVLSVGVAAPAFAFDFSNNERGPSIEERTNAAGSSHAATYGYQGSLKAVRDNADFRIIYLRDLSRGDAAVLKNASADKHAEAQSAAQSNPGVASELAARGISVDSVVGVSTPFSGRTVYYVK